MSGPPRTGSACQENLIPGTAAWPSRSGVVLGLDILDNLSMLTATRKPKIGVSLAPLSTNNRSDFAVTGSASPLRRAPLTNLVDSGSIENQDWNNESPSKKKNYERPRNKLADLDISKKDFMNAFNFDNHTVERNYSDQDMDGVESAEDGDESNYQFSHVSYPRVGPDGDSNSNGSFQVEQDTSVSVKEEQNAKEQRKIFDKFKQMRQLQLQQREKLIQQQQQQLVALRQEQQRVQHILTKQKESYCNRRVMSPAINRSNVRASLEVAIRNSPGYNDSESDDSDGSEMQADIVESYEYGSDKENIPINTGVQEGEDEVSSDEDGASVAVEGVVPIADTESTCSDGDQEPSQLYSSYEVETMVRQYFKRQKRTVKEVPEVLQGVASDEEEYLVEEAEEASGRRMRTPSPEPEVDTSEATNTVRDIDDIPISGSHKTFEQLLNEQLHLEEKELLGAGYSPSPKRPRKKTFLRKGEGIARFSGQTPKAKTPVGSRRPVPEGSQRAVPTGRTMPVPGISVPSKTHVKPPQNEQTDGDSKQARNPIPNRRNDFVPKQKTQDSGSAEQVPIKTLLLKPLKGLNGRKPAQGIDADSQLGNHSMNASCRPTVEDIEKEEKDELDELKEFELLEKVAANFSFTSSTCSMVEKMKEDMKASSSRYEELMKQLAMESSSDYTSSESSDVEDEVFVQDRILTEEKNVSHISSEVSTPRKMQRKIASKESGMAVTEREVTLSDFHEPEGSDHSESADEQIEDIDRNLQSKDEDAGHHIGQHGDSSEKLHQENDFDDEESWGDFQPTPKQRALQNKVRPFATTAPIRHEKGDLGHVEKVKAIEEDGPAPSPAPVSKLMTKLFPKLKPPQQKPSPEKKQCGPKVQAGKQEEGANGAVSQALHVKLLEIEQEIMRFRTENAAIAKIKAEREEGLNKLRSEMEKFEKQKNEELKNLQEFKEEELKKLKREKKLFEKYRKEAQAIPDKKQRDEIEQLKNELCDLRDELKKREQRWTAGTNRMRNRVEQLEKENTELKEELCLLEKRRVELWQGEQTTKTGQKSQLPVRKAPAITQQVLPTSKSALSAEQGMERKISQERKKGTQGNALPLNNQSKQEEVSFDDVPFSSTVVERTKSPTDDMPRGQVSMITQSEVDRSFMVNMNGQKQGRKSQAHVSALTKIDKGDHEYEETRHKDGKIDRFYTNGAREILYANGTRREISNDGQTIIVSFFNGDIKQIMPDHRVIYFYAEAGTTHTTYPDGLEILQFPNQQIEKHYPDGTREITFPDQIIKYIFPNGCEESIFPDSTVIRVDTNGDRTIEFANGQREIHTQQFKKREYPDGTSKTVYPDGRQETRYSTGRLRVKDKEGNIILDQIPV